MKRNKTKPIRIGDRYIGGDYPIAVQSMTNTDTSDVDATVRQILMLEKAGCDIIRVSVPDMPSARALKAIKQRIHIPLVADIHFDYRLAIAAIDNGADKLRINPGNIGGIERVKAVVDAAKEHNVPIRIGVNSGSLEKHILAKHQGRTPEALVESALNNVKLLEDMGFYDMVISIKSSDVMDTIEAYRLISRQEDYPLHVGVTEAGTVWSGTIKSCVGIGTLLAEGIGDTLRVSLTGDPVEEVRVGIAMLKALGFRKEGVEIISCPTCARCNIDLIEIANEVERRTQHIKKPLKIAVMGCAVNGPGEASAADVGIAGGKGEGLLFKNGNIVEKVPQDKLVDALMEAIKDLL
ncbi:MAG: (E)-4-hydroxy-3-methylbut-2-enyl-diphosphate synthase [Clostridiales bacterium]|nr:(E)-4-hydroxy-3-methylbut-2-enyl-diphosphate synthase [Clostridiales bacterium]